MKTAEAVLEKLHPEYIYENDVLTYGQAKIAMKEYARIQIEKDRDRIFESVRINPFTRQVSKSSITGTPIILD